MGQTALNVTAGGRTRWAAIWSGVWMLVILAIFSGLVAKIALPTLAAVLIFAGVGSLKPGEIKTILQTGRTSQVAVITTFGATLFLPVAAAVGIGVALSLLLQLNQGAMDVTVVELVPRDGGRFEEHKPPADADESSGHDPRHLRQPAVRRLPAPCRLTCLIRPVRRLPVVVLRLRRRTSLGATFVKVVDGLRRPPGDADGLAVPQRPRPRASRELLARTGQIDGPIRTFEATSLVGESTQAAYLDAEAWLVTQPAAGPGGKKE